MKHCSKCQDALGKLHPRCQRYAEAPIRMDAEWNMTPVQACLAHEEMLEMRDKKISSKVL